VTSGRWDGVAWSSLRGSPGAFRIGMDRAVLALEPFDDGSGPALYLGGEFRRAEETVAHYLARWRADSPPCHE